MRKHAVLRMGGALVFALSQDPRVISAWQAHSTQEGENTVHEAVDSNSIVLLQGYLKDIWEYFGECY